MDRAVGQTALPQRYFQTNLNLRRNRFVDPLKFWIVKCAWINFIRTTSLAPKLGSISSRVLQEKIELGILADLEWSLDTYGT